jgi:hypothetical protein
MNPLDMVMKDDLNEFLVGKVLPQWRKVIVKGDLSTQPRVAIKLERYVTAGSAVVSPERYRVIGRWLEETRRLDVHNLGVKRDLINEQPQFWFYLSRGAKRAVLTADQLAEFALVLDASVEDVTACWEAGESFRCRFLVPTIPATNDTPFVLSEPRMPEWYDERSEEDEEQFEIACGLGSDGEYT